MISDEDDRVVAREGLPEDAGALEAGEGLGGQVVIDGLVFTVERRDALRERQGPEWLCSDGSDICSRSSSAVVRIPVAAL